MKRSILGLGIALLVACGASEVQLRGAQYSTNLEECNRNAKTLCESIECENHWRVKEGRFPRTVPKHCQDAGAPWSQDARPEGGTDANAD